MFQKIYREKFMSNLKKLVLVCFPLLLAGCVLRPGPGTSQYWYQSPNYHHGYYRPAVNQSSYQSQNQTVVQSQSQTVVVNTPSPTAVQSAGTPTRVLPNQPVPPVQSGDTTAAIGYQAPSQQPVPPPAQSGGTPAAMGYQASSEQPAPPSGGSAVIVSSSEAGIGYQASAPQTTDAPNGSAAVVKQSP